MKENFEASKPRSGGGKSTVCQDFWTLDLGSHRQHDFWREVLRKVHFKRHFDANVHLLSSDMKNLGLLNHDISEWPHDTWSQLSGLARASLFTVRSLGFLAYDSDQPASSLDFGTAHTLNPNQITMVRSSSQLGKHGIQAYEG